jgi:hypothetical protein
MSPGSYFLPMEQLPPLLALLEVKPVAKFHVNFPRIVPMKAPKRNAVIDLVPPVRQVEGGDRRGETLPEVFSES